jgi:hypothetical protein
LIVIAYVTLIEVSLITFLKRHALKKQPPPHQTTLSFLLCNCVNKYAAMCQWLTPEIPATQEAEIKRIAV